MSVGHCKAVMGDSEQIGSLQTAAARTSAERAEGKGDRAAGTTSSGT
jgi:hypothetical protein